MDPLRRDAAIREGIDACRPGHDDLRLPELAHVAEAVASHPVAARHYAAVQRADEKIKAAIADVAVPEGLRHQIIERLRATHIDTPHVAAVERAPCPAAPATTNRRRLGWTLAASAVAAASVWFAYTWQNSGPVDVIAMAEVWHNQLSDKWRPMSEAPGKLPQPYRLAVRPRRWQQTVAYQRKEAIAYDVSLPRAQAVLFVVALPQIDNTIPTRPPAAPQESLAGKAVAVWRTGNQLCMLVVDGDDRAYRALISTSAVPLAKAPSQPHLQAAAS